MVDAGAANALIEQVSSHEAVLKQHTQALKMVAELLVDIKVSEATLSRVYAGRFFSWALEKFLVCGVAGPERCRQSAGDPGTGTGPAIGQQV